MANDFSGDPNCVAVWRFEDSPGFTSDSKGTNTLTNSGADIETTTVYEGTQAASFVLASTDYMTIADADQDAGFPWRHDDGVNIEKSFSICFRIYINSLPFQYLFSKYKTTGNLRVFAVIISVEDKLQIISGYNSGASWEVSDNFGTVFQTGRWYSVGVTYDASDYSYRMRIYDHTADALLNTDTTGVFSQAIDERDVGFYIGERADEGSNTDSIIDEVVVFNDVLTVNEIDAFIAGTYGVVAGWSGKINGIASANIAKVNGIAIANIAKINGV